MLNKVLAVLLIRDKFVCQSAENLLTNHCFPQVIYKQLSIFTIVGEKHQFIDVVAMDEKIWGRLCIESTITSRVVLQEGTLFFKMA